MPRLPLTAKGAGLALALFPPVIYSGEWETYQELKAHVIRSDKTAKSRPLPTWLSALEYEPRPHYRLDLPNVGKPLSKIAPVLTNETPLVPDVVLPPAPSEPVR